MSESAQVDEREALVEDFKHDFSTAENGIVPLDHRRPRWHFTGLLITFEAGFGFLFIGTQLHDGGLSLGQVLLMCLAACAMYFAYVLPAAYLGSRTGQTHSLLTRSVFGVAGSWLVSAFIFVTILGWVGYQAGLMIAVWNGLYGWPTLALTLVMAGAMIFNNLFGFMGISAFARYAVTPLLMVWVVYLIVKGVATDGSKLSGSTHPVEGALTFWPLLGVMLGFAVWGNEPDVWRYGKPRFWWPVLPIGIALSAGFTLFVTGGWMMARLAGTTEFGSIVHFMTNYSLFGAAWLMFVFVTVAQIAIVDGCYYEAINPLQNLFGGIKGWRRWFGCALAAAGGVLAGWLVNYHITNGFFQVANLLSITVPTATVIMAVDHFLLPRLLGIRRPKTAVPSWKRAGGINVPAMGALVAAVLYGAWATGVLPGVTSDYRAPGPVAAWVLGGVLYVIGTALAKALSPGRLTTVLGFSEDAKRALTEPAPAMDLADDANRTSVRGVDIPVAV